MTKKITVAVLFGGKSVEHEVSLQSAKNVINAIDRSKYNLILIGIDKSGKWHLLEEKYLLNSDNPKTIALGNFKQQIIPYNAQLRYFESFQPSLSIDVAFPILHGSNGEDGTVQGLLKLADIPFVGADVLGSAIGMDKDVMKRLLRDAGIFVARFFVLYSYEQGKVSFSQLTEKLGSPIFVKPANMGSSIGISKVQTEEEFQEALLQAFQYDHKVIIEEMILGREIECSILGNEFPSVSLPCEMIPKVGFQSYSSKYLDEEQARCILPAQLTSDELREIQKTAMQAYKILCCEGFGRVDLFLTPGGKVYVNEINTIPGMTDMSPYVKMWEASGISFTQLIDTLIQLALERFEKNKKLKTHFFIEEKVCNPQ